MIWFVLGLHAAVALVLAVRGSRLGRETFWLTTVPPLVALAWAVDGRGAAPRSAAVDWVPGTDLTLAFRVGPFAELLTYVVAGVGLLVFVYATDYIELDTAGAGRLAATLMAFAGSMLGLVWSDSIFALFVFWELSAYLSHRLIGHRRDAPGARAAARRALLVTGTGGFVMLAGLGLVAAEAGTSVLSEMGPASGRWMGLAGALVVVAAATKSAQVPFHQWLPGALMAPSPVSAYLHSATLVKTGVVLLALTSPVLRDVAAWNAGGIAVGSASVVWGAVAAVRHDDAKAILAWATISQVGLMILLLATGEAEATFAAVALLANHAIFKAALFMVVGDIEVRTGESDLRRLGGLAAQMPIACTIAVVAGASMAGLPTVVGFAAKTAAVQSGLDLTGVERVLVLPVVVFASVMAVAYTVRLLLGLFGPGPTVAVEARRPALLIPPAALAVLSLVGFAAIGGATRLVLPAATSVHPGASVYRLLRWPGLTAGAAVVMGALVVGGLLGVRLSRTVVATR